MTSKNNSNVSSTYHILYWTFGTALILFSIVALIVYNGVTAPFDQTILLWINQHTSPTLDMFFLRVTDLGGVMIVAMLSVLVLIATIIRKRYFQGALLAAGMGGVMLLNLLLKSLFERTRPDLWEWLVTETSYSFPSGHATASMALALCVVIILWRTKWRVATIVFATLYVFLVGLSRTYLGVHFPSDIIGGWLLALSWVSLVTLLLYGYERYLARKATSL